MFVLDIFIVTGETMDNGGEEEGEGGREKFCSRVNDVSRSFSSKQSK